MKIPSDVQTYLAWTFTHVLQGSFKRDKKDIAHHEYPILAPLPILNGRTKALEGHGIKGPFIYFVVDQDGQVCYIGKSKEATVIKRWVRPGVGGPVTHYWTHSTSTGGSVFNIAEGLRKGEGPYSLRYSPISLLLPSDQFEAIALNAEEQDLVLARLEADLIRTLGPKWNR